jgi:hypothetical protein
MKTISVLAAVVALPCAVAGLGTRGEQAAETTPPAAVPAVFAGVFVDVPSPGTSLPIPELRRVAKPGDEVLLEVKVMGTREPFVDNRAIFVVGDEWTLISCDLRRGHDCPTPWDNCCDDPKAVREGTATIQVVDADGKVLRHEIKGVAGLKELSRLRIAGVVAPNSTEAAFVINAQKIEIR